MNELDLNFIKEKLVKSGDVKQFLEIMDKFDAFESNYKAREQVYFYQKMLEKKEFC